MRSATIAFGLALCCCVASLAQQESLLSYYDSELFKVNYQTFGGLVLTFQGQSSSVMFGIPENYRQSLLKYPDSQQLIESYFGLNRAGNILLWGGLAAFVVGTYMPLASLGSYTYTTYDAYGIPSTFVSSYQTAMWVMVGGLLSELVASFVLPSSFEKLTQAVNVYNRRRVQEFGK